MRNMLGLKPRRILSSAKYDWSAQVSDEILKKAEVREDWNKHQQEGCELVELKRGQPQLRALLDAVDTRISKSAAHAPER